MSLRKLSAVLTALLLASSTAIASQTPPTPPPTVSGTWAGSLIFMKDGQVVDQDPVHMVLKHEGAVVSGTAGPSAERQFPIAKGKAATTKDVTTITFEVTAGNLVIAFDLKLVDGKLKGSAVGEKDGDKQTATVELQAIK